MNPGTGGKNDKGGIALGIATMACAKPNNGRHRRWARVLLASGLFVLSISCQRTDGEKLDATLLRGSTIDVDEVADLCKSLGSKGEAALRNAINESADSKRVSDLAEALLRCNVNGNLGFVIEAVVRTNSRYDRILESLVGRLDGDSERVLEKLLDSYHSREFLIAAQIYGLISDSPRALAVAKAKLIVVDWENIEEVLGALNLLQAAAFHNSDESSADLFVPFLENSSQKPYALLILLGVPGERAEKMYLDYARRKPGYLTEDSIQRHLELRRESMKKPTKPAPGWRVASLSPIGD